MSAIVNAKWLMKYGRRELAASQKKFDVAIQECEAVATDEFERLRAKLRAVATEAEHQIRNLGSTSSPPPPSNKEPPT